MIPLSPSPSLFLLEHSFFRFALHSTGTLLHPHHFSRERSFPEVGGMQQRTLQCTYTPDHAQAEALAQPGCLALPGIDLCWGPQLIAPRKVRMAEAGDLRTNSSARPHCFFSKRTLGESFNLWQLDNKKGNDSKEKDSEENSSPQLKVVWARKLG